MSWEVSWLGSFWWGHLYEMFMEGFIESRPQGILFQGYYNRGYQGQCILGSVP